MSDSTLPNDVEALKALVLLERARSAERELVITTQQASIDKLQHLVDRYAKWTWGPRSEKRAAAPTTVEGQAWLPFADLLDAAQRLADEYSVHGTLTVEPAKESAPKSGAKRRSEFPAHLPRVRTTIEVAESDRMCCKQPMEPMGFEISKELERIELAIVHETARTKYCCRVCQMQVLTAPGPKRPFPKCLLGTNWLCSLAVERFGNHMPYHRLEQKYASEGLSLSRTILSRSTIELAERFEGVHAALGVEVTTSDTVFADETHAKVQRPEGGPTKKAWMWLYANKDGECFFDYSESRGQDSPRRILKDFVGYLHDDGYIVYEVALDPGKVKHVACWAHVRRKFDESMKSDPEFAAQALAWIAQLFAIDSAARKRELDVAGLHALRQEHAPAILTGFKAWLEVRRTQVVPESGMGKAIQYALGRWEALCRFLEDGRLELDNNRSERAVRPVAVGRKNWMFLGNERGGKTAAVFYSLIATCKARGINAKTYLHDVTLRLAAGEDPKTLTPREWQARHAAKVGERRDYVLARLVEQLEK